MIGSTIFSFQRTWFFGLGTSTDVPIETRQHRCFPGGGPNGPDSPAELSEFSGSHSRTRLSARTRHFIFLIFSRYARGPGTRPQLSDNPTGVDVSGGPRLQSSYSSREI